MRDIVIKLYRLSLNPNMILTCTTWYEIFRNLDDYDIIQKYGIFNTDTIINNISIPWIHRFSCTFSTNGSALIMLRGPLYGIYKINDYKFYNSMSRLLAQLNINIYSHPETICMKIKNWMIYNKYDLTHELTITYKFMKWYNTYIHITRYISLN